MPMRGPKRSRDLVTQCANADVILPETRKAPEGDRIVVLT